MICLGQKFGSYSELKCAIQEYEKKNFVQVWTSDSRTIESAKKRGLRKEIKEELRYAEITYSCIQSGKYKSRSKGERPNQSTCRQGCESKIRLKASKDGLFLQVVLYNENHNHELNKHEEDDSKVDSTFSSASQNIGTEKKIRKRKRRNSSKDLLQTTKSVLAQPTDKNFSHSQFHEEDNSKVDSNFSSASQNFGTDEPSTPVVSTEEKIRKRKRKNSPKQLLLTTKSDLAQPTDKNVSHSQFHEEDSSEVDSNFSSASQNISTDEPRTPVVSTDEKKRKRKNSHKELLQTTKSVLAQPTDECQIFGDFVGSELRSMKFDNLRRQCKCEIQQSLLRYSQKELQLLSGDKQDVVVVPDFPSMLNVVMTNDVYS